MLKPTIAVIGAGLSGLHTADKLLELGYNVTLYEARDRVGGRVYSHSNHEETNEPLTDIARFDLGPSWFWRGQAHIEAVIDSLGLKPKVFEQYLIGDGLYEPAQGSIQRGHLGFSMAGSLRLEGGLHELVNALLTRIKTYSKTATLKLASKVEALTLLNNATSASTNEPNIEVHADGDALIFDHVILALPPRIALQHIRFSPAFDSARVTQLNDVSTWMAGQAKAVVEYSKPFWKELGLSGDAISHRGPLAEIHDASSDNSDAPALFGFLAVPPPHRAAFEMQKDKLIKQQLIRLFGEQAANPKHIFYQNWAQEEFTATSLDQTIPNHHPRNVWPSYVEKDWGSHLIWSGSESAPSQFNGYLEGALEASECAIERLQACSSTNISAVD